MHATSDPSRKNMRKFLVFNLMFTILSPRFRCSSSNESLFFHRSYSRCSQVEWTRAFVTGVFSLPPICFPWHIFFSSCRCIAPIRTLFCGSVTNVPATHPNTLWLVFFHLMNAWKMVTLLNECVSLKLRTTCSVQLSRQFSRSIEILQPLYGWFGCLFTTTFYVSAISYSLMFIRISRTLFTQRKLFHFVHVLKKTRTIEPTELITEFFLFTLFFYSVESSRSFFGRSVWRQQIVSCSWLDLNYIINDTLMAIFGMLLIWWAPKKKETETFWCLTTPFTNLITEINYRCFHFHETFFVLSLRIYSKFQKYRRYATDNWDWSDIYRNFSIKWRSFRAILINCGLSNELNWV